MYFVYISHVTKDVSDLLSVDDFDYSAQRNLMLMLFHPSNAKQ